MASSPAHEAADERSLEEELFGDEDESVEEPVSADQSEDEMSFAEVLASEEESEEAPKDKSADVKADVALQDAQLPSDLDGDLTGALEDAFDDPVDSALDEAAPPSKAALTGAKAQKDRVHDDNSYEELSDDDSQDLPPLSEEGEALPSADLGDDLFGDDGDADAADDDDDLFGDDDSGASLEEKDASLESASEEDYSEESSEESSDEDDSVEEASEEEASAEAEAAPPAVPSAQESELPQEAEELPSRTEADPEASVGKNAARGASEVAVFLNGKEVLRTPLRGPRMVIGRESKADIHLDQRALSRRHACIEKRGAAIWVQDLGSANKTYVNDELIDEPVRMHAGDRIQVGHYEIVLEGLEQASSSTPVVCLEGPEGSHRFAMIGDQITIGRAQSCDISIAHKSISRRHLTISVDENGGFFVEDLGSQNGVIVRGQTIDEPAAPEPGEEFQICEFSLSVGFLEDEEIEAKKKKAPCSSILVLWPGPLTSTATLRM
ncbi:MAG: FHA domain-containing protein [Deltaproteobacteria bacterium]|nr:FHA domain-containing protein [Deltaproteobacteria bacterium]